MLVEEIAVKISKILTRWIASATLCAIASYSPSAIAAPKWIPLGVAKGGDRIYVELDSIRSQDNIVWYWALYKYGSPQPDGLAATQTYQSANCKTRQIRVRTGRQLDALGQQIDYFNDGDQGEIIQVRPGEISYLVLRFVCPNIKK
jgi:hypothetical protein